MYNNQIHIQSNTVDHLHEHLQGCTNCETHYQMSSRKEQVADWLLSAIFIQNTHYLIIIPDLNQRLKLSSDKRKIEIVTNKCQGFDLVYDYFCKALGWMLAASSISMINYLVETSAQVVDTDIDDRKTVKNVMLGIGSIFTTCALGLFIKRYDARNNTVTQLKHRIIKNWQYTTELTQKLQHLQTLSFSINKELAVVDQKIAETSKLIFTTDISNLPCDYSKNSPKPYKKIIASPTARRKWIQNNKKKQQEQTFQIKALEHQKQKFLAEKNTLDQAQETISKQIESIKIIYQEDISNLIERLKIYLDLNQCVTVVTA